MLSTDILPGCCRPSTQLENYPKHSCCSLSGQSQLLKALQPVLRFTPKSSQADEARWLQLLLAFFSDQPGTNQPVCHSMSQKCQSRCGPATIARLSTEPIDDHPSPHLWRIGLELHIARLCLRPHYLNLEISCSTCFIVMEYRV